MSTKNKLRAFKSGNNKILIKQDKGNNVLKDILEIERKNDILYIKTIGQYNISKDDILKTSGFILCRQHEKMKMFENIKELKGELRLNNARINLCNSFGPIVLLENGFEIMANDREISIKNDLSIMDIGPFPKKIKTPSLNIVAENFTDLDSTIIECKNLKTNGFVKLGKTKFIKSINSCGGSFKIPKLNIKLESLTLDNVTIRTDNCEDIISVKDKISLNEMSISTLDDSPTFAKHIQSDIVIIRKMPDAFMKNTSVSANRLYIHDEYGSIKLEDIKNENLYELLQKYQRTEKPEIIKIKI